MIRVRLLGGVVTTLAALSLALLAGPAAAKTVYDYEYSGTYVDGSAAGGTFGTEVSGLAFDPAEHLLYVADGGSHDAWLTRLKLNGEGVDFQAAGSPRLHVWEDEWAWTPLEPQVSLDRFGGASDGNLYVNADGRSIGYDPDGTRIPDLEVGGCTIAPQPPTGEEVLVGGNGFTHYTSDGEWLGYEWVGSPGYEPGTERRWSEGGSVCRFAIDGNGNVYGIKTDGWSNGPIVKTTVHGLERYEVTVASTGIGVALDSSDGDLFVINGDGTFERYDEEGRRLGGDWGVADPGNSYPGLAGGSWGMAVDPETHDVWVANRHDYGGGVAHVEKFVPVNPHVIPDTTATSPVFDDPNGESLRLRGVLNPDGVETTSCFFEYGTTQALGTVVPCAEGDSFSGSADQVVTSASIALPKGQRYWYRLFAANVDGQAMSNSAPFFPQGKPLLHVSLVDRVNTDGARMQAEFDPNGGNASVHFEFGVKGGPLDESSPESDTFGFKTENGVFFGEDLYKPGVYRASQLITGLQPGTTYEYKAVVTNEAGSVFSEAGEFTTYEQDPGTDPCPNSLARQQSGSSLLLDCRGYELVSAANAGGYDIEAEGVAGQMPLMASPRAKDRLLYSPHFGVIPGVAGSPTNYGLDPYVAVRDAEGWTTEYVGLPSNGMADDGAFGSPLLGADPALREFAFGGGGICDPCFSDGSINIPLRAAGGGIEKGMQGALDPGAAGNPSEVVRQPFSADGKHFVFGSQALFESGGDPAGSIYERDLSGGGTEVVSTLPDGSAIPGGAVAELGISDDGSRVVIGREVGSDAKGNPRYHLYMHRAGVPASVDLTPGASSGASFDGADASGSRVFLTTTDQLLPTDTDQSADVYEASVGADGSASLRLVSTHEGTPSNDDGCDPPGVPGWNVASGAGRCDALAFAGGAGTAADGTFFFLSPELLDGSSGTADDPNLYVVEPGGDPRFVATIDSAPIDEPAIEHAVEDATRRSYGDFQVTPDGRFAAFASRLPLTGYPNFGNSEIYRYDAEGGPDALACASCSPTGGAATHGASLNETGLNLTDDGRVFFTTRESLALRDTNEMDDAYEWTPTGTQLISTGISSQPSGLVTVGADGRDAFFFTREKLVPQDENGNAVKIYDAREGGGFVFDPARKACAASDECHGAGSNPPGPPAVSTITGAGPRETGPRSCRKGFVRRQGKCVKKHRKHRRHHRKTHHRNG